MGDPVAEGGFGQVYKGHIRGLDLAVKVLKVNKQLDTDKLRKVQNWVVLLTQLNNSSAILVRGCYMAASFAYKHSTVLRYLPSG